MIEIKSHLQELETILFEHIIDRFYPLCLDKKNGGYFCSIDRNWNLVRDQTKVIVTQARNVWVLSKIAKKYPEKKEYLEYAQHGFEWIKNQQWDHEFGGWFKTRSEDGGTSSWDGYFDEKRTYGMAFGLYGVAAYYDTTKDPEALKLAIKAWEWLEKYAYDKENGGYYMAFDRENNLLYHYSGSKAQDHWFLGYKDEDDLMHVLEAFTEFYHIWPDETLKARIIELIDIHVNKMIHPRGNKYKFFKDNWELVQNTEHKFDFQFCDFGHDIEMGYLLLEAAEVVGLYHNEKYHEAARKMVNHSILQGFDNSQGGFYNRGHYEGDDSTECLIDDQTKYWWPQFEAINTLLLFSRIYPKEEKKFLDLYWKQWEYIKKYLIDYEKKGILVKGLDKTPDGLNKRKGQQWKATYHDTRAILNMLRWWKGDNKIAGL